jgi:hypothetical protein
MSGEAEKANMKELLFSAIYQMCAEAMGEDTLDLDDIEEVMLGAANMAMEAKFTGQWPFFPNLEDVQFEWVKSAK